MEIAPGSRSLIFCKAAMGRTTRPRGVEQKMDTEAAEAAKKQKKFELKISYSTNKKLEVGETETIDAVKIAAMGLFDIEADEAGQYILRSKVDHEEVQLDEGKTVADYGLKNEQKVILAAGSPFGAGAR